MLGTGRVKKDFSCEVFINIETMVANMKLVVTNVPSIDITQLKLSKKG